MRHRFPVRFRAAAIALFALAMWPDDARAQVPTVGSPIFPPTRHVALRDPKYFQYWINRQDCLDQDVFTFSLSLTGQFLNSSLQVWAGDPGTDCTVPAARTGNAPTCWELAVASPTQTPTTIAVNAVDVVAKHLGLYQPGSTSDCNPTSYQAAQQVVLSFMFVSSNVGTAAPNPAQFNMGYDIWGPNPPTGVNATPGETRLVLNWTASTTPDIVRYDFYCDPPRGTKLDAGAATAGLRPGLDEFAFDAGFFGTGGFPFGTGGFGTGGFGTGGFGTGTGGTGVVGAGGAGGTTSLDGSTATGSGGAATAATCSANSALQPGRLVDRSLAAYNCGGIDGPAITSSGIVEGLTNDVHYTVAVAGVDAVLNTGALSNQTCATPIPVTDFFELYRAAGGKGGGGICSVARLGGRAGGIGIALGVLAASLALARRKRRR